MLQGATLHGMSASSIATYKQRRVCCSYVVSKPSLVHNNTWSQQMQLTCCLIVVNVQVSTSDPPDVYLQLKQVLDQELKEMW